MYMKTVFLAGAFTPASRARLEGAAANLRYNRYDVVSKWHDDDDKLEGAAKVLGYSIEDSLANAIAIRDLYAITGCDVFILDTFEPSTTGAYHTELGIALATDMRRHVRMIQVGPINNAYQTFIRERYSSWAGLLAVLAEENIQRRDTGNG